MSNPDGFIDEVTEEVRRDRLFAVFRKYGWIGAIVVVFIVGGETYNEWRKSIADARAEEFGDSVRDALNLSDMKKQRDALGVIAADGDHKAVLQLLLASDPETDREAVITALNDLANDISKPQNYRDLATLRLVLVQGTDVPVADRRSALDSIAAPGRPFRVLALEQMAYLLVEEKKTDEAIAALNALLKDQKAPAGLRSRVEKFIVALGGEVQPASVSQEPAAQEDDAG
ncbi:MAG: tetratricopeptide repeat protein [Rhodobacteraceae bacterium]|nr:tetratricopeptide repeat protein [Paracoccaceae bacterium]